MCEVERLTNAIAVLKEIIILVAADRVKRSKIKDQSSTFLKMYIFSGGYSDVRKPTIKDWLLERDREVGSLICDL